MVDLKQWLYRKLHLPVIGLILVLILGEAIHIALIVKQNEEAIQKTTTILSQYVSLGVQEQNRSLIEYTFGLTYRMSNAKGIALCDQEKVTVQIGSLDNLCARGTEKNLLYRKIIRPIIGSQSNFLVMIVPVLADFNSLIFIFLLSIFLLILLFSIQRRMLISLQDDILDPLMSQNKASQKIKIKEVNTILEQLSQVKEAEKDRAIAKLSSQVAHDIRSPLTALNMSLKEADALPEEKRILIRSAVMRITDIANQLSFQNKNRLAASTEQCSSHLVSSVVENIISEKRMQFRNHLEVDISFENDSSSYGIFGKFNALEFKTVLSNLINNSVEALENSVKIEVSVEEAADNLVLKVKDNGKGIEPNHLAKMCEFGFTQGKPGTGSGLGLFHAKQTVQSWGGQLKIQSQVGVGTTVSVLIPRAETPEWFLPAIDLSDINQIVVLDDDISIHNIWEERLQPFVKKYSWLTILHCSNPNDFRVKVADVKEQLSSTLFLVDFELIGHAETGLDLIEELDIAKSSVLVSSRFEDSVIQSRCEQLGIKFIPKNLAPQVPIFLSNGIEIGKPDAVLIDDDFMIRILWEDSAKDSGINLATYSNHEEFFKVASTLRKTTPIYIDSKLGADLKGEEVAKTILDIGFNELFLTTGYDPNDFKSHDFFKGIINKEPPWYKSHERNTKKMFSFL